MPFWKKPSEGVDWLGSLSFFDGFGHDELVRVAALSEEIEAKEGALLMDQGDPGLECFVVVSGECSIYVAGEHIATSGAGAMVGEMALVDHRPRTASVIADSDMRLLRFDARQFRQLLDEMPKASERVMRLLTERLQRPDA